MVRGDMNADDLKVDAKVRGQENLPFGIRLAGGQGIVTIGFPRSAGPWATITGTIVSRQGRIIDIAAALDEGNSGGPLIQNGKVVEWSPE
jgi:hypothetical protein